MPSSEALSKAKQEEFYDSVYLCVHTKLAKITGRILSEVYCLPDRTTNTFVRRVHGVLNDLRKWDAKSPTVLRLQANNLARDLYTLHMHCYLCIIQTTMPILLHIFKTSLHGADDSKKKTVLTNYTRTRRTQSARTANQLLSKLFIEGNLAMYGFFDAYYLFSSTLVLIIAAVMEPTAAISDAVQMAFNLLKTMSSNGNVSPRDYLDRLGHIRATVSAARAGTSTKQASVNAAIAAIAATDTSELRGAPSTSTNQIGFGNE